MADKPKKIIPDADYKRLMPKFRTNVISESAAKRLGLTGKPTSKAEKPTSKPKAVPPPKKAAPKVLPSEVKKPVEPKAKPSVLKKKVVDDAPITISKGKRGATKWRKGNGPWRYDEPPAQHKPKVVEPPKETRLAEPKVVKKPAASKAMAAPKVAPPGAGVAAAPKPSSSSSSAAGTPTGTDIRAHFTDYSRHPAVGEAINAIAAVHGDGGLSSGFDMLLSTPRGNNGVYFSARGEIHLSTRKHHTPALTVIHEIGHALDDRGPWGGRRLTGGVVGAGKSGLSPTWNPDYLAVQKAIESTNAVRDLRKIANGTGDTTKLLGNRGGGHDVTFVKYLLQPNELWARAYTQYIASKQPDRKLLGKMKDRDLGNRYKQQWNEDDFKPIEAAIDQVIRGAGWRK